MDQKTLKQFEEIVQKALVNVTTKEDLKGFATKDDLLGLEKRFEKRFATKDDLLNLEKRFEKKFATKDDIKDVAKKSDLRNLATKDDVKQEGEKVIKDLANVMKQLFDSTDNVKVSKTEFEKRVGKLEREVASY